MVRYCLLWLAVVGIVLIQEGCAPHEQHSLQQEQGVADHTLVMYLLADSGLNSYMLQNKLDAERGMMGALPSARLLVYLDAADSTVLYESRHLPYGAEDHIFHSRRLKAYDKQNSTDVEVLKQVMADVRELAPSRSYGLVMAGHGTGWFPKPSSGTEYGEQRVAPQRVAPEHSFAPLTANLLTRHLGYDNLDKEYCLTSQDIIDGLDGMHFEYIIFDACFMGSVEFLYDLRHLTDYVLSSPVEVMNAGFPYEQMVEVMMSPGRSVVDVAETIMDTYLNTSFSSVTSVAVSVVDCSKLEALADAVAPLFSPEAVATIDREQVQTLERMSRHAFFDLEDVLYQLSDGREELYAEALADAIVYAANTPDIYSYGSYDDFGLNYDFIEDKVGGVLELCGLSCYLPYEDAPATAALYYQTDWAKKVYQ